MNKIMSKNYFKKNRKKISKNIKIIDPKSTFIEENVEIGEGTIIYPNNYIKNGVKIGKNCVILPNNLIEKSQIGDNVNIGPSSHIRPDTVICKNVKIGNFCEIKASFVGDSCKISHLTYIGDTIIGERCNFGCGVITANFNGKIKQKIEIGNDCFLGCNVNLIAPLKIGDNCYICAGATVTNDLKNDTFLSPNRECVIAPRRHKK